jgi:hypothetical protein
MWLARFRKRKSKGECVAPTKKALELLYSRQVNVPGIILNDVDTSSPEDYYYQHPNTTTGHLLLQKPKQPRNTEPAKPGLLELRF